jgi:hypothetical protein
VLELPVVVAVGKSLARLEPIVPRQADIGDLPSSVRTPSIGEVLDIVSREAEVVPLSADKEIAASAKVTLRRVSPNDFVR